MLARFLLVLTLALAAPASQAQDDAWRLAEGPYGGTVITSMIPFEESAVLAGSQGGVFRSDDGGLTWASYSEALPGNEIRALLRLDDGSVLAATHGDGVFRRGEGMGSWISTGLRGTLTQCLAADSSGTLYAGTTGGLMRSTDNGLNWKIVGFFKYAFGGVKAVAANRRYVFASTVNGIFRSNDGGLNWEPAMAGLSEVEVSVLSVNQAGDVYAGTSPSSGIAGLYRTRNDGDLWTRMPLSGNAYQMTAIGFDDEGRVYAGGYRMVYRTEDGGNTWQQVNAVGTSITAFAFSGDKVLIGTHGRGVMRSGDEVLTFKESNEGLFSTVNDMIVLKGVLYAGTSGGVYASWDYGRSWWLQDDGLDAMHVSSLAIDGNGLLVAGTRNGVYRLYENPHAWSKISPAGMPELRDLTVAGDGTIYGGYHSGLFIASKTGIWTQVPLMAYDAAYRDVIAVAVDDASGQVFAGSHYDSFRSAGAVPAQPSHVSWMELTMASGNTSGILTFENGTDGYLYAGTTYEGIVRTSDGGDSWNRFGSGLTGDEDFVALESAPDGRLYGATYGSGVITFDPSTNRWSPDNRGLRDLRVVDVVFDETGYGYAATLGGGVYVRDPHAQVRVEDGAGELPQHLLVDGNYPNPFNPSTTIRFDLPSAASVWVDVFDGLGRRVLALPAVAMDAGHDREIAVDASALPTGLYAYRITAELADGRRTSSGSTMMLLK